VKDKQHEVCVCARVCPQKASVKIFGVMTGIQTNHLPEASPGHHQPAQEIRSVNLQLFDYDIFI
jgi:hypothetical protein